MICDIVDMRKSGVEQVELFGPKIIVDGLAAPEASRRGQRLATIYALVDPHDPVRVRYVGQTVDPFRRYDQHHCNSASDDVKLYLLRISRRFTMIELEVCPEADGPKQERWWLRHYRSMGMADLNQKPGTDKWVADIRPLRYR